MTHEFESHTDQVVWRHNDGRRETVEAAFLAYTGVKDRTIGHQRSIENPGRFWSQVIDFLNIPVLRPPNRAMVNASHMSEVQWFEGASINFAHACLAKWENSDREALIEEREDGSIQEWSGRALCNEVRRGAGVLRDMGVSPGDRVLLLLPMSSEGVIALLSVAWLGAVAVPVFSGFGVEATRVRLLDSKARLVVTMGGLARRGRPVDLRSVAIAAMSGTPAEGNLLVWGDSPEGPDSTYLSWNERARNATPVIDPASTDAHQELLIAYTSGTTGKPKGVVHTHGGLTVKLAQEGAFQLDIQPGDRAAWVTDLGWIMSAWIIASTLINSASLVCYSGAPNFPNPTRIFDFARRHQLTALGLSPSLIRGMMGASQQIEPADLQLPNLMAFGSSGEPWTEQAWWWLFEEVGRREIPIVNFTGGTEVAACFLSVSLLQGIKPLSVGSPCWGMDVDVWSTSGPVNPGAEGELVCKTPWPSMARTVWGDHQRFLDTYFDTWPDVWRHGDRASRDDDDFWTLHGRSDDVMNIAGKRLGPVEVEAAVLSCPGVAQVAAVGVPHPTKGESIALFVVLTDPTDSNEIPVAIAECIRASVISALGKAFTPSHVVAVADLPRTRTAKTVRRAIRSIALGDDPGDLTTIDNPEVLSQFPVFNL